MRAPTASHPTSATLTRVTVRRFGLDLVISLGLDVAVLEIFVGRKYHQVCGLFEELIGLDLTLSHRELPRLIHVIVVAAAPIALGFLVAHGQGSDTTSLQLGKLLSHRLIELRKDTLAQFFCQLLG